MHTKSSFRAITLPSLPLLALGCLSVVASFAIGMRTAGDVQTITPSEAVGTRVTGDMNADGIVNVADVIEILEVVRGYKQATTEELSVDPNGDGVLTVDDALRLLHDLQISH